MSLTTKKKVQLTNSFLNIVIIITHNSSVDLECPYLTSTSLIKKLMVLIKSQLDRTKNMNNNTSFNDLETFFLELSSLPSVTLVLGFVKQWSWIAKNILHHHSVSIHQVLLNFSQCFWMKNCTPKHCKFYFTLNLEMNYLHKRYIWASQEFVNLWKILMI